MSAPAPAALVAATADAALSMQKRTRAASKRKRAALSTPPPSNDPSDDDNFTKPPQPPAHTLLPPPILPTALSVLAASARALEHIHTHYSTSPAAQAALAQTVDLAAAALAQGARLVLAGVGKSGIVAQKTAATLRSFGLTASFLHAGDALHGDLGDVREADVLVCVSASGAAPELVALTAHIPPQAAVVAVSALDAGNEARCRVLQVFDRGKDTGPRVLLPACIGEDEAKTLGVRAPMPSTAVAMAVGDMLALSLAERVHGHRESVREVFERNHPGGAIGVATRTEHKDVKAI